jgi:hypothetical protein
VNIVRRVLIVVAGLTAGCSAPDDGRTNVLGPDPAFFGSVAAYLEHRCGSLDCHGTRYRNLRMWGQDGMRLAAGDVPGGRQTTSDELDATYLAIVELEPEVMAAVVADHGSRPERLTLLRKARGTEKHAGGAIMAPGDPRDTCLVSWLASMTDVPACNDALVLP